MAFPIIDKNTKPLDIPVLDLLVLIYATVTRNSEKRGRDAATLFESMGIPSEPFMVAEINSDFAAFLSQVVVTLDPDIKVDMTKEEGRVWFKDLMERLILRAAEMAVENTKKQAKEITREIYARKAIDG